VTEREHDRLAHNLLTRLGVPESALIQTHISSVITAGDVVYKLKKPVDFGFLDYSTPARRKRFCEEEVRINGRYAPQLYLGVVPVTGSVDAPRIGEGGEAIEYAVKMRRFDPSDQLDAIAKRGELTEALCDAVADMAAAMHSAAPPVDPASDFGSPERVLVPMQENFDLMASLHKDTALTEAVAAVRAWTLAEHARLAPRLRRRKAEGFIRECHGDLHLHNMALFEGRPMLFDAIEFNPYLSHIDVISDLAFLLMDLEYRGALRQSRRILNRYLERTGDYEAALLLPFYKTYRAMVRAKVLALHAAQDIPGTERVAAVREVGRYVALAASYREARRPFLALMHGLSGSGKSTAALEVVETFGALRLRSDAERMRLFGGAEAAESRYAAAATEATYARLAALAETLLAGGVSVVADATFLAYGQRERFEALAARLGVTAVILDAVCGDGELKRRIRRRRERAEDVSEADETVLAMQRRKADPLTEEERRFRLPLPCDAPFPAEALAAYLADPGLSHQRLRVR